jgi:DNA-directed RNA polymerase specialized sigma24 family protein
MDDGIGYKILEKLDTLIKLSAFNLVRDKEFKEQVRMLSESGLQPKEIAEFLGKTPNNVRVTLSTIRKEKRKND